ncbi:DNA internalization-related competence protein ComEC/Rec2 [Massilia sp. PAMC28688]|uniref:DNA internalization-related competence protein ComEC/Rec2 n=1 Tax=Massilia sp. PAMC28688 TaxID=2861283 RepID=UPI001C63333A|nr:DNA internalization-related competence protein ComEC/Rec2 [Massilia sp. PAMC28688]QYF93255.1 DNA internalization-related competence protein ComEC/Rec2 [Massilia sp. PAMC28688]
MRTWILGFAAGAAWLQTQAALPGAPQLMLLAACALVLGALHLRWPGTWRSLPMLASGILLGFAWAAYIAQNALGPSLARADEGRDVTIVGVVHNLPYEFAEGVRFNFSVEQVEGPVIGVPPLISLAWYGAIRGEQDQARRVRPGERWRLTVRLQRPHGNANPHGFDFEVWLLEQGIRATGYVREEAGNARLAEFVASPKTLVERSRAALRDRILAALPGKPYAGVIVALVVGDQRGIDQTDWKVFTRTGVGHLISISGLHITMIAGMGALLVSALWRRSFFTGAQLPLLLPAQKVAALAGIVIGFLYVLLAGFGIPAQRTLYMLTVVGAAVWLGRISSVSHVLSVALGVVVLLDPWAVLSPGFWLSFGAVAMILYATVGRSGASDRTWRGKLLLAARTQYVVTVGLVPLTMLLFSQVSLASPIANAIAIPLISLVVTPLSLAGSMLPAPLSTLLLNIAHAGVAALAWVLEWLSAFPMAVWSAPQPAPWVFGIALFGTLWLLAPRGWPLRWLGMVAWLPLLAGRATSPVPGHFVATVLDVGQGTALLVETHRHRLLYDTGPQYSQLSNAGARVILPYLKARGIGKLDALVVTHSDVDHAGGALSILEEVPVGWITSSLRHDHPIVARAAKHVRCAGDQSWHWDGVLFEMLQPSLASYGNPALKPNARGCTLKITAGENSMLLAADIEAAQEGELVVRSRARLAADVLLVPHHGSGTSSTLGFLHAVAPRLAVFQVGYRNRYRHPKAEVYARYGELNIERLRTDADGAITISSRDAFTARRYRHEHARYWYGR